MLPKMHKITQNSLLKKHGIFCLTFSEKGRHKKVLNLPGVFGTMSKCAKKPGSDRKHPKERS